MTYVSSCAILLSMEGHPLPQPPTLEMQPVPLATAAGYYGATSEELESELFRLGVPTFDFLGQRVFYFRDLYRAHSQPRTKGRAERIEHLERVLGLLRDCGCIVEEQPRTTGRPSDVFTVRNAEDPGRSTVLKVQVGSRVQSGGAIHFNIPTASLNQGVKWYWMVAPPFHPRWDFLLNSDDAGRQFGDALKKNKLVTMRIKAEGNEYLSRENRLDDLLADIGIGHFAMKRAQQKALTNGAPEED